MTASERLVLVIDPAIHRPEVDAYNYLLAALEQVNNRPAVHQQSMRFWLPQLGNHRSLESFLKVNDHLIDRLSGVISLGSYAHVTEIQKYQWRDDYWALIELIIGRQIPFLGICFAHQFLAMKHGLTVDYCRDKKLPGARKHHVELRLLEILSPRLRALCMPLGEDEWRRNSPRAVFLRRALQGMRQGLIADANMARPISAAERALAKVLAYAPNTLRVWSRHEQMVYGRASADWPRLSYHRSLRAEHFEYDGLIHERLPVFTLQTHPERPHTADSDHFIKNFLTLCGLKS